MLKLIFISLLSLVGYTVGAVLNVTVSSQCGYWPGWNEVRNIFSFGDSYSATGFLPSGKQPSDDNPIGNPPFPGFTSSDGTNWVGYIVTKYNASTVRSYNLAWPGATVDTALVKPVNRYVHSLKDQVNSDYMPVYGNGTKRELWSSSNSLFIFWIGINDVLNSGDLRNTSLLSTIFSEYAELIENVYASGARNFLLLDVPTIQDSPLVEIAPTPAVLTAIQNWASKLVALANNLRIKHPDVTIQVFSTYNIFQKILNGPTVYQQTANLTELNGYCPAYENGTAQGNTFVASCTVPVDQYFWLNDLHPTFPVHDALAFTISNSLAAIPSSSLLCQ